MLDMLPKQCKNENGQKDGVYSNSAVKSDSIILIGQSLINNPAKINTYLT